MNIGIFTDCYLPTKNGVVTSIIHLKEGLERRGHKVVLFTVRSPRDETHTPHIHRFPSLPALPQIDVRLGLIRQPTVNRLVQRERLDILHTHTEFSLGVAAKRAAKHLNLPRVHTMHTMYDAYRHYVWGGRFVSTGMIQGWIRWFLRDCSAVICPSQKARHYLNAFLPSLNACVIGNGVSQQRFSPHLLSPQERRQIRATLGIEPSDDVILSVGRLAQEKRTCELLDALGPHLRRNPHMKIVFVGDGPSRDTMRRAAATGNIGAQVIFTGYVAWERIPAIYAIADLFVTASLSEMHPMTVIEACMCGLPVIARRDICYADLVKDG